VLSRKGVHEGQQCIDPAALDHRKGRIKVDQIMHPNGLDRHAQLGRSIPRFTSAQHHACIGIIPEHGNARRIGRDL
jgi:hypothetical protein